MSATREIRIAMWPGGPERVLRAPKEDPMKPTDPKRPDHMPGSADGMVLIHSVSRAQARADGELVPVPEEVLREHGFTVPMDLTGALHRTLVARPETFDANLHDLLTVARLKAEAAGKRDRIDVTITAHVREGRRRLDLVAMIAGGDEGKPEVTIGFQEDF